MVVFCFPQGVAVHEPLDVNCNIADHSHDLCVACLDGAMTHFFHPFVWCERVCSASCMRIWAVLRQNMMQPLRKQSPMQRDGALVLVSNVLESSMQDIRNSGWHLEVTRAKALYKLQDAFWRCRRRLNVPLKVAHKVFTLV